MIWGIKDPIIFITDNEYNGTFCNHRIKGKLLWVVNIPELPNSYKLFTIYGSKRKINPDPKYYGSILTQDLYQMELNKPRCLALRVIITDIVPRVRL